MRDCSAEPFFHALPGLEKSVYWPKTLVAEPFPEVFLGSGKHATRRLPRDDEMSRDSEFR